jgi:exosome complex component CSL4
MSGGTALVVPGDPVGVVEEYVYEDNVCEDAGTLRSCVIGVVETDKSNHTVRVRKALKKPSIPVKGDVIGGIVTDVRPKLVTVDINLKGSVVFEPPFTGLLPIGYAARERVETLEKLFVVSDVIRAKVVNERPPFVITTDADDLGVILAHCTECGSMLRLSKGRLVCERCGTRNFRKLSSNYVLPEVKAGPVQGQRVD